MALYNVLITKSASKELEAIPEKDRRRIIERIRGLSSEPRPFGVEKLSGDDKYRIRQGNFRILYEILDRDLVVTVIRITEAIHVYLGRPETLPRSGSLRDLAPEPYPDGNERLSSEIDTIVYSR